VKKLRYLLMVVISTTVFTFNLIGSDVVQAAGPTMVDLGTAANFAILAGTPNITNVPTSIITGHVGLSPATGAGIGLTQAQVTGTIYAVDDAGPAGSVNDPDLLTLAKNDLTAAYTDAAGRTPVTIVPTELGGTTLTAGVYASDSTTLNITAGAGPLVLDGQGDATSVFIFEASSEVAGALTVGPGSTVSMINGASACNVFWRVYGATIDTTAVFKGSILSLTSITVANGANIEGRLLARNGNVTLIADTVTIPDCTAPNAAAVADAAVDAADVAVDAAVAARVAADAAAAATQTRLPGTGIVTSQNTLFWSAILLNWIFTFSIIIYLARKRRKESKSLI